ncbi:MAG: hypothetical protein AAF721_13145 [Myxococcota bacterium]
MDQLAEAGYKPMGKLGQVDGPAADGATMQIDRTATDADDMDLEALFERWDGELAALETALSAPKPPALAPGTGPGRPLTEAWKAEMQRRTAWVQPMALEMAQVYARRLEDAGRRRIQTQLAAHPKVVWQFVGPIKAAYEAFLVSRNDDDMQNALALTAIYDLRSRSRDFERTLYPLLSRMKEQDLDPATRFAEALPLATKHEDPQAGAYGLFVSLAERWAASPPA